MAIKCIALDLDGTTLLDDKRLSGRTRKAMEAAISKGVRIVAASEVFSTRCG
jgi:hydroxymethylpyrimidine pyrophosphatase-like HAD family hydrolase